MLKREQSNLFILGVTCMFFTIALLSVFLYSTDKLILDVSNITKSGDTSQQKIYPSIDKNIHFKIVNDNTSVKHNLKRSAAQRLYSPTHEKNHYTKSAPILSYDVDQKSHPFFSEVKEAATLIPKVAAASPLFTVGKLSNAFLLMAAHSVKILSTQQSE